MRFAIVIFIVLHYIVMHVLKKQCLEKNIAEIIWHLKNFERVTSYEIQKNMFVTSWPAAGAGLVQIPPPVFFRIFLRRGGYLNVFLEPIAPQYREKSRHRDFFRSNSKSPVPGKYRYREFFLKLIVSNTRELPLQGIFRSNSKSTVTGFCEDSISCFWKCEKVPDLDLSGYKTLIFSLSSEFWSLEGR